MFSASLRGLTISIASLHQGGGRAACGMQMPWEPGAHWGGKSFKVQRATPGKALAPEGQELWGGTAELRCLLTNSREATESEWGGGIKSQAPQKAA